jgi:uncharacterized membrane protein YcjF (UPF0283 family)
MKEQNKFSTGRHQEQAAESQTAESQAASTGAREFQSVEELLRHDAAQTAVPPEIARRLSQSIAQPAPPRRSWWRKLLG